jgi:hypothetical protein
MSAELLERLNERLDRPISGLRFSADSARHDAPASPR